jgi:hypothetical protein
LLTLTLVAAPICLIILLAGSLWPVSLRSKPGLGPVIILLAVELVLIVAAVLFQVRNSWLYEVRLSGRM